VAKKMFSYLPGRRYSVLLPIFFGIGLALFLIYCVNVRIRPVLISTAFASIENDVILMLTQAADSLEISYNDIIHIRTNDSGQIIALQNDMNHINAYRNQLLKLIAEEEGTLKQRQFRVPFGSLTGSELLSGRGPGIPVQILSIATPNSGFENIFTSAGINQTRHQVMLQVTVKIHVLLAGITETLEIAHQICVAETIIVGTVPEHFTYLGQTAT